ncbi:hypothetical protein OM076_19560 [Solirubrobacter ginsenosidimutans]|uniref:DUF2269 family protein n=1 Tax=Solirubrobacter ginsenosidimutans TaxID=490573 RepID=A0A9X3S0U8_9ACTN|nr:hypothetical protein [Solirubrobacter ginsenosidimutans]MDA0162480.1 hypothetical protein [Solirubrobacter ginsenosidimutans]
MSTYTVVVAAHIIAVVAAYGLPLSAPLLVPYVRRHHPEALNGLHSAQYRLNNVLTGPFTVLVLAFGIYLASDGHRWGDPFVSIGVGAIAIIAVVGGAVVVPAVKRLAALDPSTAEYAAVYRRYLASESFLGALVLVTIFAMAAKPFS